MDVNQFSGGHLPYMEIPVGLKSVSDNNDSGKTAYESLTETEKEHLLMKCKDAKTAGEKQKIVSNTLRDTDIKAVAEEEAASNSYKDSLK